MQCHEPVADYFEINHNNDNNAQSFMYALNNAVSANYGVCSQMDKAMCLILATKATRNKLNPMQLIAST